MAPELVPVQPHGRFGVDRAVVVALAIVSVVVVALLKPWGTAPEPEVINPTAPVARATERHPEASPSPAPMVTLSDVVDALGDLERDGAASWVFPGPGTEPVSVPFVAGSPSTNELGLNCSGAVLLGEGATAIGVTLPETTRPSAATRIAISRLFDGLSPVRLPVESEVDDSAGVALVRSREVPWAPGYYSLTFDVRGRSGIVPFCVGAMLRDVDYSLMVFVPATADSETARRGLLAELAPSNGPK